MDVGQVRDTLATWERIADSFDQTRTVPWRPVVEFLHTLPEGADLLDAGTGNGRHAAAAMERGLRATGLDASLGLLHHARARAPAIRAVRGLLERLPFQDRCFDAGIAIASLHHVRGRDQRIAAWVELARVMRPRAPLLVSVWARDQPRFRESPPRTRPPSGDEGHFEEGDAWVAWSRDGLSEHRYVHLYDRDELGSELGEGGWVIDRSWSEALASAAPDNHFALAHPKRL